jgi:hypothetical protein
MPSRKKGPRDYEWARQDYANGLGPTGPAYPSLVSEGPSLRLVPGAVAGDARSPIRRAKGSVPRPCGHRHVEVDPRERRVLCVDCGVEVDPYVALDMLAQEIERYDWARDSARNEAERARRDLENLRRLERNAKARVRTATRDAPACSCDPPARWGRFCRECGGRVSSGSSRA